MSDSVDGPDQAPATPSGVGTTVFRRTTIGWWALVLSVIGPHHGSCCLWSRRYTTTHTWLPTRRSCQRSELF
jgi:hypothetical protein